MMPLVTDPHLHARSALNLRRVLAVFGLCASVALGVLALGSGDSAGPPLAAMMFVVAVIAAINLVVVQRRLTERRRRGGTDDGLFG